MLYKFCTSILIFLFPLTLSATSKLVQSGAYVTLSYILKVDGNVQDKSDSFSFIIGSNQVIEGFESGMLGMRAGESKTIVVPPERGYGTGGTHNTVAIQDIAPVFTYEILKKDIADTIESTIDKKELSMYSQSEFSVGNMLVGANGKKARIIGIEGERVTLRIDNRDNPFYKKSKKVGTTVKKDDVIFRIILENTDSYTLQVRNMKSPFYKKPWKVGAMVKTSDGTIIKILKINPDTVDIDTRHPMVGKTLTFNINIISIQ